MKKLGKTILSKFNAMESGKDYQRKCFNITAYKFLVTLMRPLLALQSLFLSLK